MGEELIRAYTEKYVRTGNEVIVPKAENPIPQMKYDSVRLQSTPDFGGLGVVMDWQYVCEAAELLPVTESGSDRYITFLGGDMTNQLELGGAVEFTIGKTEDDLRAFTFDRAVSAFVETGMLYGVRVVKINDPKYPVQYNELIFNAASRETQIVCADYEKYFKSGDEVWARRHPHPEVVYPCVMTLGEMFFKDAPPIRRSWMPVSEPFEMEIKSHSHEFDQFLTFCGSDPEHIGELGGVVEFTIGEEGHALHKFSVSKATQFFVKKGLLHSPLVFKEIYDKDRPILFCETSFTANYGRSAEVGDRDEKSEYELFAEKLNAERDAG